MVTPLLKKINSSGGTLYTFPSAQRDLARVFTNSSYSLKFSHFACLNLKNVVTTSTGNYIRLQGVFPDYTPPNDNDIALPEHLQNYVMNFETAILNGEGDDDGFDNDVLRSPAERVFFNWFQKVNGIEFEYANRESNLYYEKANGYSYNPIDPTSHVNYVKNRTVKYIGNIDVINTVEIGGDIYSEVYLHIPSSVGASYEVRFNAVTDNNYNGGDIILNSEKIIGAPSLQSGLSTDAIYDEEVENKYTGDIGYIIDFRDSFYVNESVGYGDIMTMNELSPDDFEFNCVLIYYDLTNNTTGESATNLYGILFLNKFSGNNIQRYPKHKTTNLQNGNSFALKVDIKVDAYPTSTGITIRDSENTGLLATFQEYIDDMTRLQQTIDIFNRQQSEISRLQNRVNELELLLYGIDSFSSVENRVGNLETRLNGLGITDQEALTDLISEINQRVNSFISSQNNPASVVDGYGTHVTNENGIVTIDSTTSTYSINGILGMINGADGFGPDESNQITQTNPFNINSSDPNESLNVYTTLEEGPNLAVLYVENETCSNDVHFYIDDSDVKWKVGQTLKIMIRDLIDFNGHNLIIHTGLNNGTWEQNIKIIGDEISSKPTIEIICTNAVMNQSADSFVYDCMSAGSQSGTSDISDGEAMTDAEIEGLVNDLIPE